MEEEFIEYSLTTDINGIRSLKSSIEYLIQVWPGSPARPAEEQVSLKDLLTQLNRIILEHTLNNGSWFYVMTEPDTKQIFELYDIMESKLNELDITFDEFIVLYKSFRNPPAPPKETPKAIAPNPFPWAQAAGVGWS